jgi:hypothetical protein
MIMAINYAKEGIDQELLVSFAFESLVKLTIHLLGPHSRYAEAYLTAKHQPRVQGWLRQQFSAVSPSATPENEA